MTDQYFPAPGRRFLEDIQIKGLQPKTQTMYLRAMRDFTQFLGRSSDTATPENLRALQLDMKEKGVGALTLREPCTCCGGTMRIIDAFRRGQVPVFVACKFGALGAGQRVFPTDAVASVLLTCVSAPAHPDRRRPRRERCSR